MKNSKLVYTFLVLVAINLSSCLSPHKLGKMTNDPNNSDQSNLNLTNLTEKNVQVYFTPWDDAEAAIVKAIDAAQEKIYIQAYVWSSKPLTAAILDAKNRGVKIYILADKQQLLNSDASLIPKLSAANIPVNLETKYQSAHNKVLIIDPNLETAKVITGSYNFTYSAQYKNAENILILNNQDIAKTYLANWRRHQQDAAAY